MSSIKTGFAKVLYHLWRRCAPVESFLPESNEDELEIIRQVSPFTMTSAERIYGLITAIRYLEASRVPGDFVECGVWKGGSMMVAAKTLLALNSRQRELHLFDTFA